MSRHINVNPGHYKVAGRERQGEDIIQQDQKQLYASQQPGGGHGDVPPWEATRHSFATAQPEPEQQPAKARTKSKPAKKAKPGRRAKASKKVKAAKKAPAAKSMRKPAAARTATKKKATKRPAAKRSTAKRRR